MAEAAVLAKKTSQTIKGSQNTATNAKKASNTEQSTTDKREMTGKRETSVTGTSSKQASRVSRSPAYDGSKHDRMQLEILQILQTTKGSQKAQEERLNQLEALCRMRTSFHSMNKWMIMIIHVCQNVT